MTMHKRLRGLILMVAMSFAAYAAYAETVTISTSYPSPFGSYQSLDTMGNTHLATTGGGVRIGDATDTAAGNKLELTGGDATFDGNLTLNGPNTTVLTAPNVTVSGNLNLTDASSNSGNLKVSCSAGDCYAVYA